MYLVPHIFSLKQVPAAGRVLVEGPSLRFRGSPLVRVTVVVVVQTVVAVPVIVADHQETAVALLDQLVEP